MSNNELFTKLVAAVERLLLDRGREPDAVLDTDAKTFRLRLRVGTGPGAEPVWVRWRQDWDAIQHQGPEGVAYDLVAEAEGGESALRDQSAAGG